jgi:rod shape-determining protein MreC
LATSNDEIPAVWSLLKRILFWGLAAILLVTFLVWRIDNPRVERFRMAVVDQIMPGLEWVLVPVNRVGRMISDFQSYSRVYEQNQELRRELQRMKGWQEVALQLEQRNARLRALNNVRLSPRLTYVTGEVLTDAGSPFSQSALLNIGRQDGVQDGSAAMDDLGLVGRVSGVGERSSRVIFLTDINSRVPVIAQPSGQRAIVSGDNSAIPRLEFVENSDQIQPGDRVFTSGAGGLFPSELLVGQVALGSDGRPRIRLAAEYRRLEFIRVLRQKPTPEIDNSGELVGPRLPEELSRDFDPETGG